MTDYQLVVDIWEGNPQADAPTLLANGIVGMIVRLNSMSGGHHMDSRFAANWEKAKQFPVQAIYFVYNPWVSGRANYEWLAAHLPADYGDRRIFADIEVRYAGYSPNDYAKQTAEFMAMVRQQNPASRYSGGGFLNLLSSWPKDEDYWWAAYPKALDGMTDWAAYRRTLESLSMAAFTSLSPGPVRLWQCSADSIDNLPGFGGRAVDVNKFPGTLEDLRAWFNCSMEVPTVANAIGLLTKTTGWDHPTFDFIAGYAGKGLEINPNLKPIELKAVAEKKPFMLWYDFDSTWYSDGQYMADPKYWPGEAADKPFQEFIKALSARTYNAVIIGVGDNVNDTLNRGEDPGWFATAARWFVNRVSGWLSANRPGVRLIVASSDAFIKAAAPDMDSWVGSYPSCAWQRTTKPLVSNAWPDPSDKPAYLDNRATCEFWRYWEINSGMALTVFRMGDAAGLRSWLGIDGVVTPPPTIPGEPGEDVQAQINSLVARVAELEAWQTRVKAA